MTITSPPEGAVAHAIAAACDRIAPTWPLDQFIAVNPYWGWRTSSVPEAAARLGVLAGTALTMPRSWFQDEWRAGRIAAHHVEAAATASGDPALADVALALLQDDAAAVQPVLQRAALITDLRDLGPGPVPGRTWSDLAVHQIGQHLAAHFDEWQSTWAPDRSVDLFTSWRVDPSVTHGFRWRNGAEWARTLLGSLPASSAAAIVVMLDDLDVPESGHEAYLTAVLASVNGWAAWCAYQRWQARLAGSDDDTIVDLMAIRLAWEWLLAADADGGGTADGADGADEAGGGRAGGAASRADWAASWADVDELVADTAAQQRLDWVLQTAAELTYQDTIIGGVRAAVGASAAPDVQAVFCIDVRSEVFRRALESVGPSVHTRGFAGFFGLPIAYTPIGSRLTRPQLPGLLAPMLEVSEDGSVDDGARRAATLDDRHEWERFQHDPSSVFTFVESMGLFYGVQLVKDSLAQRSAPQKWEHDGLPGAERNLRPRLPMVDEDPAAAAALGHRILTGMGLLGDFAPLVLLCGHGSHSANNPHASGLDCGACGGQTGEVNARVLADLLNATAVRHELARLGVVVPEATWFVPALHDTTTDTVELFDAELAPSTHQSQIEELTRRLRAAGVRARAERAAGLGLGHLVAEPERLQRTIDERANDWSQVRPEWGLAGNAAFVVAPRSRTKHMDLQGRSFLHEYDWRMDPDLSVLTLIMTAPMVVTNWINLQYHASTVDNRRYGSGNKVLHNVVGGRIGVFEGNGGDLRIGLSMQSLHDGHTLRHRPLRLSVFIEAPRASIDTVIGGHTVVQDLVFNGWLHLLRIDPDTGAVERRTADGWQPTA